MTRLINQLMNDEAVYRTAPATPGLFKTSSQKLLVFDDAKSPAFS